MTVKIGNVEVGRVVRVVGVITDHIPPSPLKSAKKLGADLIEARLDSFNTPDHTLIREFLNEVKSRSRLPIIATIRSIVEGGSKDGNFTRDKERLSLFKNVIDIVDAVDIELSSRSILKEVMRMAGSSGVRVILSYHNFSSTPPRAAIEKVLKKMNTLKPDIIKIATWARSGNDVIRLMEFTRDHKSSILATMSMGENGVISRIVGSLYGSCLTYGFFNAPSAPGQISVRELRDSLRKFNIEK